MNINTLKSLFHNPVVITSIAALIASLSITTSYAANCLSLRDHINKNGGLKKAVTSCKIGTGIGGGIAGTAGGAATGLAGGALAGCAAGAAAGGAYGAVTGGLFALASGLGGAVLGCMGGIIVGSNIGTVAGAGAGAAGGVALFKLCDLMKKDFAYCSKQDPSFLKTVKQ